MQFIKYLWELNHHNLDIAGGKAINLGEMINIKLPIPPGFCVTTTAYIKFIEKNDLQEKILSIISVLGTGDISAAQASEQIQELFTGSQIPEDIVLEIQNAYKHIDMPVVAVRSSATAEDLATASFAGQQDTYLNIRGEDDLVKKIVKCWASLWTERAIVYRQKENIPLDQIAIGVVIQEMVNADAAGIMFTANPVTRNSNEIVINASWGLGEAIVDGVVTPDCFIINKQTKKIIEEQIFDKKIMTVCTEKGTEEQQVPIEKSKLPAISPADIRSLVKYAKKVEKHYKQPMDIEWAVKAKKLYLLQARPITTLHATVTENNLMGCKWSRLMIIERFPEPITPFTWSFFNDHLFDSFVLAFQRIGLELPTNIPFIHMFNSRPYINISSLEKAMEPLPFNPISDSHKTGIGKKKSFLKKFISLNMSLPVLFRVLKLLKQTPVEWYELEKNFIVSMEEIKNTDINSLTLPELMSLLDRIVAELSVLFDNHARSIIATDFIMQLLKNITSKWFHDINEKLFASLLSGLTGNLTVKANQDLWEIAQLAAEDEVVKNEFLKPVDNDWLNRVNKGKNGKNIVDRLTIFLEKNGHRSPYYELMQPTWVEQPEQIILLLQKYIVSNPQSPGECEKMKEAERISITSELRDKISFIKKFIFDKILNLAQVYFRLRENQQYYLAFPLPLARRILATMSKKLIEQKIFDESDDIFYLEYKQIKQLVDTLHAPHATEEFLNKFVKTIKTRKDKYWKDFDKEAPVELDDAAVEIVEDFGDKLKGIPASSGRVEGIACIILTPRDFEKFEQGMILVAPATTPAWTPLFSVASGLVTNYGSLLSHSAVVAREYGLPAVLAIHNATTKIKTGDKIIVDGNTGHVYIGKCNP